MAKLTALLVPLFALASVVGCTGSSDVPRHVATSSTATSSGSSILNPPPKPPVTAPAQSPAARDSLVRPYAMGRIWRSGIISATVFAFRATAATQAPPPHDRSHKWAAADVELCFTSHATMPPGSAGFVISDEPWTLAGIDNGSYQPSHLRYPQFPQPAFPREQLYSAPGACVRGWIVFDVPKMTRMELVRCVTEGASGTAEIGYWRL